MADSFGLPTNDNMATSFLHAREVAKQTGTDLRTAALSKAVEARLAASQKGGSTSKPALSAGTLRGLATPPKPYGLTAQPGEEDYNAPVNAARTELLQGFVDQYNKADSLQSSDASIIKKRIIFDLQPTEDIDAQIKKMTRASLVAKVMLNDELKSLSPSDRRKAVAERMQSMGTGIDNLLEIRQKRMDKIDAMVTEQVDSSQRQEKAQETRFNLLSKMTDSLDKLGASREESALSQLTLIKARTELQQLRNKMNRQGVGSRLGDIAEGPFTAEETNAFQMAAEAGAVDASSASSFFETLFGIEKGPKVTNASQRFLNWRQEWKDVKTYAVPGAFDNYGK